MDRRLRNLTAVTTVKNVTVSSNFFKYNSATLFVHCRLNSATAHTGEIVGGIAGTLLFIIVVAVLILYRNWKYEQELDSLLWKVNYKDIEIKEKRDETVGANEEPAKCNSKVSACSERGRARILEEGLSFPCVHLPPFHRGRSVAQ